MPRVFLAIPLALFPIFVSTVVSTVSSIGISIVALVLIPKEAQAQFFTGPVASATGGAGRAAVDPGESAFLNPAMVAHLQKYYVSGSYGIGDYPHEGDYNQFSFMLADGNPANIVRGAASFVQRSFELPRGESRKDQDIMISAAGFAFPHGALGFTVHRLQTDMPGNQRYTQNNAHAGLLYTPTEWFGLSLNVYDAVPASESVPIGVRVVPTFAIGSHALIVNMFRLRLDAVRPDKFNPGQRIDVMTGLETYFHQDFAFRLGALLKETSDQTFITLGLGYHGPRLSFDYSIQKETRTGQEVRHLFDLWLHI